MDDIILYFSKIHPDKSTLSFTWDDNFIRHSDVIAPLFKTYNIRCTFYVNPGEPSFPARLSEQYARLSLDGFEIGSHGYSHHHYSKLTELDYLDQLIQSQNAIGILIGKDPVTFAFPHHDYTQDMLQKARNVYFETRNTLVDTPRFSLKRNVIEDEVIATLNDIIQSRKSLVFSGHSVSLPEDETYTDGYEPIPLGVLHNIIEKSLSYQKELEICTFEQAVLKKYIINNCHYTNEYFKLSLDQVLYLEKYRITLDRLKQTI